MRLSSHCLLATLLGFLPVSAATAQEWTGTWAAAPSAANVESGSLAAETTFREIVHVSRGGTAVRVTFTNELGTDSLRISAAHLGVRAQGSTLVPGSDRPLLFGGHTEITIPPGAVAVSDPVDMKLEAQADLAITLDLPAQPLHTITAHSLALTTNYQTTGNEVLSTALPDAKPMTQWRFLKNVEVSGGGATEGAVVTFGDSITDGYRSTPDTNRRWPDVLAQRFQSEKHLRSVGVLNEGISGNRVLHDGAGPNALARFDRDVLSQSGVRYVVVLEAINDIGHTVQPRKPEDVITAEQVIVGYEQMIARAHAHGIKVYGATLTPFLGANYASPVGEAMRQTVNTWIRTPGHFDAVIDFDKLTRDPANPSSMLPAFDSGDHLHPSDAGYKAMGENIDLHLFAR